MTQSNFDWTQHGRGLNSSSSSHSSSVLKSAMNKKNQISEIPCYNWSAHALAKSKQKQRQRRGNRSSESLDNFTAVFETQGSTKAPLKLPSILKMPTSIKKCSSANAVDTLLCLSDESSESHDDQEKALSAKGPGFRRSNTAPVARTRTMQRRDPPLARASTSPAASMMRRANRTRAANGLVPTHSKLLSNMAEQPAPVKSILKRTSSYKGLDTAGLNLLDDEDAPVVDFTVSLKKNTRRNSSKSLKTSTSTAQLEVEPALALRRWATDPEVPSRNSSFQSSSSEAIAETPCDSVRAKKTLTRSRIKRVVSFSSLDTASRWTHQGSLSTDNLGNLNSLVMPVRPSRRGSIEADSSVAVARSSSLKSLEQLMKTYDTSLSNEAPGSASKQATLLGAASPKSNIVGAAISATTAPFPTVATGGMKKTMSSADAASLRKLINTVSIRKPSRRTSIDTASPAVSSPNLSDMPNTPFPAEAISAASVLQNAAALRNLIHTVSSSKPRTSQEGVSLVETARSPIAPKPAVAVAGASSNKNNLFRAKANAFLLGSTITMAASSSPTKQGSSAMA